jgi:hypothetical protein
VVQIIDLQGEVHVLEEGVDKMEILKNKYDTQIINIYVTLIFYNIIYSYILKFIPQHILYLL